MSINFRRIFIFKLYYLEIRIRIKIKINIKNKNKNKHKRKNSLDIPLRFNVIEYIIIHIYCNRIHILYLTINDVS